MDAIWSQIIQGGLAFSVLALAVKYLMNRITDKEQELKDLREEIKDLHKEVRESEKEALIVMSKMVGHMERGEKSFEDLKTFINDKIDSLKH